MTDYLYISLKFLIMHINGILGGVVAHFQHVVCYLNLQQIVQHLRLHLSAATAFNISRVIKTINLWLLFNWLSISNHTQSETFT